jgi:hypothetical protein
MILLDILEILSSIFVISSYRYSEPAMFLIPSCILEILSVIFVISLDILEILLSHSYGLLIHSYRLQPATI